MHTDSPGMSTLVDPGNLSRAFTLTAGRFDVDITTIDHSLAAFCKTQGGASNAEAEGGRKQSDFTISTKQRPVPLMKIDVEGFEANALDGTVTLCLAPFLPFRSRHRRHHRASLMICIALLDFVR